MRILLLLLIPLTLTARDGETCLENLSWYKRCISSPFFSKDSKRCKRRLISDYTANLFYPLNRHLRGIQYDPTCKPILNDLYGAISSLKKSSHKILYRGIVQYPSLNIAQEGDCLLDLGYMSASPDKEIALAFTAAGEDNQKAFFEIKAQTGRDLKELGKNRGYYDQEEVILLPGTPLMIEKIDFFKTNRHFKLKRYQLREVPINECSNIIH